MTDEQDPSVPDVGSSAPRCRQCGAPVVWDPDADALSCSHCGATRVVPPGEGTILERPLAEAAGAARGFGLDLRVTVCQECGARVAYTGSSTTAACSFCGSSRVLDQDANRNVLRPESLVPLDVGASQVEAAFRKWLAGLWFRPDSLRSVRSEDALGVYVPYWTFDASLHSQWTAQSGTYYWVTEPTVVIVKGKPTVVMRQVQKVRWSPAAGERRDAFDDLLVPAGKGLTEDLLDRLGGFDTSALVPYRPEYLAGWRSEEYQVDLEQGFQLGLARMEQVQRERCSGDVPGDTQRDLRVHNLASGVRFKHVLLPVWSLVYRHEGKLFPVLVNGQSGRVAGKAPISWIKVLAAVAAGAALAASVALLAG